ncbi:MAG: glycoside hydrolase family 5 protein, partial [Prevotella sp.]|nr:glycoside hydrolase family 5 protein [Prevotella sp.]
KYMKKALLFVCSLLISMSTNAADFESAKDAVKNMGVGWNLGNTLDAHDATKTWTTTVEHETCWDQPVTKPELLKMMKEAGFGAIRVPVTWYQEMDANGKVNDAWMKRVKEVVDYVIDNGMYCIVNVHHDTGADKDNFKSWLKASTSGYNASKEKYEGLWKQIAETFKDYDQHLLFEGYNEMLDEKNTWNEPADKTDGYQAINSYAKSFVTAVRATGGNNKDRNLVVNTYSASSMGNAMKQLELPEESGHIIFQLHSYPNWKSESNAKMEIDNLITTIKTNLLDRAPVIIGEYSTFTEWPSKIDYYETDRKVAFYAMDYLIKQTKEAGIGTFYWMGLSDGPAREMPVFNQADLAETLVKAYYGSTSDYKYPSTEGIETTYIVKFIDSWSEAFLYGDWSRATKKVSDYKGFRLEMEDDSYADKVQIKVYGDKSGEKNDDGSDKYKEQMAQLASGTNTTTITFDASALGSTFWGVTLQTTSGPLTAKVKKAVLIKADDSETVSTVTKAWGCEVSSELTPSGIHSFKAIQDRGDGVIYNLSGQRVSSPSKGVYIQNGKKIIIK